MSDSKYGYSLGEIVVSLIDLRSESGTVVPSGTKLRLVAFAPKLIQTHYDSIRAYPHLFDSRTYFFNAVVADKPDTSPRIREHFVTIRKLLKGENYAGKEIKTVYEKGDSHS